MVVFRCGGLKIGTGTLRHQQPQAKRYTQRSPLNGKIKKGGMVLMKGGGLNGMGVHSEGFIYMLQNCGLTWGWSLIRIIFHFQHFVCPETEINHMIAGAVFPRDINPHIPQYIMQAPWYFGAKTATLRHQRPQAEKYTQYSPLNAEIKKGIKAVSCLCSGYFQITEFRL